MNTTPRLQRSEDQILAHAPIELQLGKKRYSVTPLTILANKEWRQKMVDVLNKVGVRTNSIEAMMQFPEMVVDLICAYDTSLPDHVIKRDATDEEVAVAFSKLLVVAYPFFPLLGTMNAMARATTTPAM